LTVLGSHARPGATIWRRRAGRGLIYAALLLVTVVMVYPFWFMGRTSLRSLSQYYLGRGYSLTSWHDLLQALPVARELFNSTLITTGAIALILVASTTAGYALGTLRYRFSGTVFLVLASAMMVPMQSMIIPEFVNLARIGFINHYYAAILVYAALGSPFATFLMTVGLATIPSQHFLDVPELMAGSLISALPAVIVYLVFQRYLIRGLTMGMSK